MHVLRANLRHLYQRRVLWAFYVLYVLLTGGLIAMVVAERTVERGGFAMLLIPAFLVGQIVGAMQMEVASKAFSSCLPGHASAVRRLVFLAGAVVSLVSLPAFAVHPMLSDAGPLVLVLVLLSGFCANLLAYLAGVAISFSVRNPASLVGLVVLAGVVVFLGWFEGAVAIEQAIFYRPELVILLGTAAAFGGWLRLGRPGWLRSRCGRPWVGLLDPWDRAKAHKFRHVWAARRFTRAPHAGIDRFFLRMIGKYAGSDPRRYIWGALYTTFALIEPQWKGLLFVLLLGVVWAGYSPKAAPFFLAILLLMMTGFINPPLYAKPFVTGGRRERSLATMAQMLTLAVVAVLVVGSFVLVLNLVEPLVPRLTVADLELNLRPVGFQMLLLPMVIFPLLSLARVLFFKNPLYLMLSIMLLVIAVMISFILVGPVSLLWMAAAAAVLWLVCLVTTHAFAMRVDLAGK